MISYSNIFRKLEEKKGKPTPSAAKSSTDQEISAIFDESKESEVAKTIVEESPLPSMLIEDSRPATDEEIDDIFGGSSPSVVEEENRLATDSEIDDIFADEEPEDAAATLESPRVETEDSRPATDEEIDDIFGGSSPPVVEEENRPATESEIDDIFADEPGSEPEKMASDEEIEGIFADLDDSSESNENNLTKVTTNEKNNVNLFDPQDNRDLGQVNSPSVSAAASEDEIDALFGDKTDEVVNNDQTFLQEAEDVPSKKKK